MNASQPVVDCHAHIIDPARFPFDDGPGYMPRQNEVGLRETYATLLARHGVRHALLVQPSCYGFDNSAMLDAVTRDPGTYKAIAMVDPGTSEPKLLELAHGGVVGVRFNLVSYDRAALSRPYALHFLRRLRQLGWYAEVMADDEQWPAIADVLLKSGVKVLIDHFGIRDVAGGIDRPGFQAVLSLGRQGQSVVKITTPFVFPDGPLRTEDLNPIVTALIGAFGIERCIWGSDWPFLSVKNPPGYAETRVFLSRSISSSAALNRVLWENPVRLFGFGVRENG
jgi:predicted TIM-barrel fold metal-dependent hydrolase